MVRRQWVSGVVAITMLLALASTALAQHFQAEPSMFRLGDNSNKRTAEPWEVRAYNARPDGRPDRSSPVWTPSPAKREHKLEANQVAVYHGAIDISSYGADGKPAKREFTAGVYGTVVRSTPGYIAVQLANGNIVQYMHASEARLKFGQQVTPDTVLGVTGNLNTDGKPIPKMGIHLHIQVSDAKGKLLDPDRAILAGRAEKQDRSIKWEKPDWIDAGPLAISSSKPIVSPDGILRADDDNKNAYLRGGNESASAANDGATQRQALEKQKSQLDAQLGELQAQERQLAAELKGIDEQGIALNREGKRMEATEAKLKAERDRLARLEKELFAEAKAVEAASATVTTNAEVDALNARIIKLNSAFKTFGDDKLAFNAKAEEITQKLQDWQSQIDSTQAKQKQAEQRLVGVREKLGQLAKSQESLKAKLPASAELANARKDAQSAEAERKRLEKELEAKPK